MAKIVHVVESFGAGTLSMVSAIANRQAQVGQAVTVIHSLREETPANWRALFDARIEFIQLPMVRAIKPGADWHAGRMLTQELRRIRPDVVHLHSSKAGALGRLTSVFHRGPRWFFSPHGLSFLQRAEGRLKNTVFLLIEKLLARIPVTFIACSPSEAEQIRANLTNRVEVVCNGVDLDAIPAAPGNENIVRIGTVGRVALARNPELFASIAEALRGAGVEFVWIGGGDESGETALKNAGVQLTGWVDRAEALKQLATLDIYIQTSRWEGLPVAVIEAMAAGLPVVATNVVGNRDLVKDGENGWLANDRDDFLARLVPLIESRGERQRLGAQAKAFARAHYSLDTMMENLNRVYGLTEK
ncbi:Glycosyltransferase involved in cell wall bisynthesis [Formivibrio citricus]|uniref:Glycosyltransferase involved in cell wall bisynthesis n=1 Tax=Formivibrio citricus TaxID=83765 RepID=A0A1I5CAL7_9NEIS|nr:glycosyltransferase [Formivibrio citricus]SFN84017.1 Glycosyltransferase involved in cell wall bisynthesis [Formivibrio citricus]